MKRVVTCAATPILGGAGFVLGAAGGPPPFLMRPILLHVGEEGLDHGHFVYTEGAALPAPIAPRIGGRSGRSRAARGSSSACGRRSDGTRWD